MYQSLFTTTHNADAVLCRTQLLLVQDSMRGISILRA